MDIKTRIGARVQLLRKRRGFSQAKLATQSGKSVEAISLIERGRTLASIDTIESLASVLGYPLRAFFDFADVDEEDDKVVLLDEIHAELAQFDAVELRKALGIVKALGGKK